MLFGILIVLNMLFSSCHSCEDDDLFYHSIEIFEFNGHEFYCFDGHFFMHSPDCELKDILEY